MHCGVEPDAILAARDGRSAERHVLAPGFQADCHHSGSLFGTSGPLRATPGLGRN